MPKADVGSLKDIGKRIKAKGLQKLKFYCQMCQKQCRDANGFKCHITSDSHLRQMKIFSENSNKYMDQYSKTFEKLFLDTLRMRHSTTKVNANHVYQEMIRDKDHIHMNSTIWVSLTDFCKYLGKTSKCIVEENERGWYIQYIERDPTKLEQEEALKQRQYNEHIAEQQLHQQLEHQRIEALKQLDKVGANAIVQPTSILTNDNDDDPAPTIQLSLNASLLQKKASTKKVGTFVQKKSVFDDDEDDDDDDHNNNHVDSNKQEEREDRKNIQPSASIQLSKREQSSRSSDDYNNPHHISKRTKTNDTAAQKLESKEIMESKQTKPNEEHPWIQPKIWVRIVTKELENGKYFRQKAIVDRVSEDGYTATVLIDNTDPIIVIRIDQDDLQTIGPKHVGDKVRIVQHGRYRGCKGKVIEFDKKQCLATIKVKNSSNSSSNYTKEKTHRTKIQDDDDDIILKNMSYDDFSLAA